MIGSRKISPVPGSEVFVVVTSADDDGFGLTLGDAADLKVGIELLCAINPDVGFGVAVTNGATVAFIASGLVDGEATGAKE